MWGASDEKTRFHRFELKEKGSSLRPKRQLTGDSTSGIVLTPRSMRKEKLLRLRETFGAEGEGGHKSGGFGGGGCHWMPMETVFTNNREGRKESKFINKGSC